jgi:lambda family phage portal protein
MARLGEILDGMIEPFAPAAAARRRAARIGLDSIRQYDAAQAGRKTQGWKRPATSADAENSQGLERLRNGARDLVRNNKYAAAGVRQIVANMVGDGIAPQMRHADAGVQTKAQEAWDRWAESKVDGIGDFYGHEKLVARSMITDGDALTVWRPDAAGPDGRITGLESDFLDLSRTTKTANGGRIVQGVEFDRDGDLSNYWLFDAHPGDLLLGAGTASTPMKAANIDHTFERLRLGQTRGVSWLAPVAMTLRDISDIEDAIRLKKKVQACLALVIQPGEGGAASPLTVEQNTPDADRPSIETLRPGMIARLQKGETASTVSPTADGDSVDFIRQQLAAVSASLVPYHLLTGDVSQANYSSLRAALLGHWALLDDWQQNVMIPQLCRPAVDRRLRRLAIETGDYRVLDVQIDWALPVRRQVDPIKDLLAEVMEIRAGLKLMTKALAERGLNADHHLAEIARINGVIDSLGLALETDPRRLNDAGALQAAVGYLAPKTQA